MKRQRYIILAFLFTMGSITGCEDILEPEPIDILVDDIVLNEPKDVPNVEMGLYASFRAIPPATVILGDFMADNLIHNGTFSQYRELGSKQISSANASVATLWGAIYNTIYIANFLIERLPDVPALDTDDFDRVMGTARFLRGYAYFTGVYAFGDMPLVTTTSIDDNRDNPRAPKTELLEMILDDYMFALETLPDEQSNSGFATTWAVRAALARFYLYQGDYSEAEDLATEVIESEIFTLDSSYANIVTKDLTSESIFEVVYNVSDDPGTDGNIGLNNLFVGRREIIPSNQAIVALASDASGDRFSSIQFNQEDLVGNDNGWSVAKYGTADEGNNDIVVFRLAEMYLIRAEANARQNDLDEAIDDLNVLRDRANAPQLGSLSQSQTILAVEDERRYELAYEGHRWFDLVRTDRANTIMPAFNDNWKETYDLLPIPQREIQNNPAVAGHQNPGY